MTVASGTRTTVTQTAGLTFAAIPGYRPLELDIYQPPSASLSPAVLYLHGGGWRLGTRKKPSPAYSECRPGLFDRVAASGFVVVSADYRLSAEARYPAQLEDVCGALRWIADHGEGYGIDTSRVMLWGDSAGAQLAAIAALAVETPVPVGAVVNWYPITDLLSIQSDADQVGGEPHDNPSARETSLLGGLIRELPDAARQASPVTHARPGAPPFLLVHGTADLVSPCAQSLRLREALEKTGNEVVLHSVAGLGHMWQGASGQQLEDILAVTLTFLSQQAE